MKRDKYLLLGALYLSQGLPYGFFTLALPIALRQRGIDLATISASGVLLLPWALKFLWGPLIDRFGSRRSWILPLQTGTVLVLLALASPWLSGDGELRALGAGMLLAATLASIQDVATDGLAVQLLSGDDRGVGNGIQVGAYRLGMIVGGSVILVIYSRVSPSAAYAALAVLLAVSTLPVLTLVEPPRPEGARRVTLREVVAVLPRIGASWWLVLALFKAGDAMASPMLKAMLVDAGYSAESLAWMLGLAGSTAGLIGAVTGGALVDRMPRQRALLLTGILQSLALATNLLPASLGATPLLAWGAVLIEHLFSGMATATLFAAMMDRCRPGLEASDFTAQACVVLLAPGLVVPLTGLVAESYGYAVHFALASLVSLIAAGAVAGLREERR